MHDLKHDCRLAGGDDSALIPGTEPDTALRIRRSPSQGLVVLEQLRRSNSAGWYVQKSFPIPETMLQSVLREMRKADCMVTRPHRPVGLAAGLSATTKLRLRLD